MHRPFVCLSCGYAGCWNGEHATEHLADEGHPFCDYFLLLTLYIGAHTLVGVDVKLGSVFCSECDDFVYDGTFDGIFHATVLDVEEKTTKFQGDYICFYRRY